MPGHIQCMSCGGSRCRMHVRNVVAHVCGGLSAMCSILNSAIAISRNDQFGQLFVPHMDLHIGFALGNLT